MENPIWSAIFSNNSKNKNMIELLKEVPAFDSLSESELKLLTRSLHTRNYSDGESIFFEGAPGAALYIVKSGTISITKALTDDNIVELAKISSPSFFGEIALIDEIERSAGAVAEGKTTLLAFGKPDLEQLIETHPRVGTKIILNIAKLLSKRLISANETIEKLSERDC